MEALSFLKVSLMDSGEEPEQLLSIADTSEGWRTNLLSSELLSERKSNP